MKKITSLLLFTTCLSTSLAQAQNNNLSIGYTQGKVADGNTLNGVNIKYRYELNDKLGVMAASSFMSGKKDNVAPYNQFGKNKRDTSYASLLVGPSYRINEVVSVYGLAGAAKSKTKIEVGGNNGFKKDHNKTAFAYGAGIQINPVKNMVVDVGYEGSKAHNGQKDKNMHAFNIGVGLRF